jgi:tape measure domain-containing protein
MTDRVIRITLDSRGVVTGVRQASGQLKGLEQRQRGVTSGFRTAAAAASAFAGAIATREILRLTNTYQSLQNQLRVVTDSQTELNAAQTRLTEIAQATRAPLQSTVELFSRASIAADELGASQEQLFRLTEITGEALAVQGSSAAESAGALRQLSQSFSSGIVRAEEFNSILEGAFPLAQAAARGFDAAGGSVGRLRNLVVEGEVSSKEFFDAILAGSEELDEQFANTEVTISQAFTTIQNSLIGFVGALSETSGAGAGLTTILQGISEQIDDLSGALTGTLSPQEEVNTGLQLFTTVALVATRTVGALADSLTTVLATAFTLVGETIGGSAAALVQFFQGNFEEAGRIFDDLDERNLGTITDNFSDLRDELVGETSQTIEALVELWDAGARDIAAATQPEGGGGRTITDAILGDPEEFAEAGEAVDEFLRGLEQAEQVLFLTATAGDEAGEAIRRYKEDMSLAAAEAEIFGDLQPTEEVEALRLAFRQFAEDSIQSQRALREEIEASELAESFNEQIEALELEIELLDASNEALGINAEARALAAGATAEQAAQIGMLTETLADEQDRLREETATLQGFFEEVGASAQQTLSGFLADPLSEGLDELPFKFAQVLQQLAADALASELFGILKGLGSGGEGGGAGGFLQFIGGLFGGGFQAGGQVRGGQPILVGERGPELFTPPGSGAVQPNVNIAQAAQAPPVVNVVNVSDPADVPTGINSPEGEEAVINVIQRNPDAVRRLLG